MTTDSLRGHSFFPDEELLRSLPDLYSTENTCMADKVIHLHYFVGSCDWYLAELDQGNLRRAFGYVNLGDPQCAEWGYFDLDELAAVDVLHPSGVRLVVERDLHWTPRPFASIGGVR